MAGLDCENAGVVIVDCDQRPGKDGTEVFQKLCNELKIDLECVPQVETPSSGYHYYFRAVPGISVSNSASVLGPGVDVRGTGGYVIAAGSVRADGKAYKPHNPADLPAFIARVRARDLPQFPLALVMRLNARSRTNVVQFRGAQGEERSSLSQAAVQANAKCAWRLEEACARVASAPDGARNDTLNREAFIAGMRAHFETLSDVAEQLTNAAKQAGLADDEIARTITGALARGTCVKNGGGDFERTDEGSIKRTFKNAMIALNELGILARRNTFSDKIIISNVSGASLLPRDYEGAFTDNAASFIRNRVQEVLGFDPGKEHLHDAVAALAEDGRFDPVNEWLDPLVWDGVPRLDKWLPVVTGAPSDPLFEGVGKTIITAMVMRARHPGSKFDACPVFEGEQGCGKSSLARALGSGPGEAYFTDAPGLIGMENKARAELLSGKWIVELAELSGMGRAETEGVKAFLSQSADQYRPAYGRNAKEQPRTCIFVATTNAQAYLPDSTGNRRLIPVPCKKIDLPKFMADRDQLFAEAVQVVAAATPPQAARGRPLPHSVAMQFGLDPNLWQAAAALADARRVTDPIEDVLPSVVSDLERNARTLPNGQKFIASSDLRATLQLNLNMVVRNNGLATWMKVLGWEQKKAGSGTSQVRGYAK